MKLTIRYQPVYHEADDVVKPEEDRLFTKELDIPEDADIADILPQIHAEALAVFDPLEDRVTGAYQKSGRLEQDKVYVILSGDVRKTIEFMKE